MILFVVGAWGEGIETARYRYQFALKIKSSFHLKYIIFNRNIKKCRYLCDLRIGNFKLSNLNEKKKHFTVFILHNCLQI